MTTWGLESTLCVFTKNTWEFPRVVLLKVSQETLVLSMQKHIWKTLVKQNYVIFLKISKKEENNCK